jgi:hypothetical protein
VNDGELAKGIIKRTERDHDARGSVSQFVQCAYAADCGLDGGQSSGLIDMFLNRLDHDSTADLVERQVQIEKRHSEQSRDRRDMVMVRCLRPENRLSDKRLYRPARRIDGYPVLHHEVDVAVEDPRKSENSRSSRRMMRDDPIAAEIASEHEFRGADIDSEKYLLESGSFDKDRAVGR